MKFAIWVILLVGLVGCLDPSGGPIDSPTVNSSEHSEPAKQEKASPPSVSGNGSSYAGNKMLILPLQATWAGDGFVVAGGRAIKIAPDLGYVLEEPAELIEGFSSDFTVLFVIEAHAQLDTRIQTNSILEKWDDYETSYPFACRFHNRTSPLAGQVSCHTHDPVSGKTTHLYSKVALQDGKYHSIAYRRQGDQFSLFLDGELAQSTDMVFPSLQNEAVIRIGHRLKSESYPFYGRIGALRLHHRALSLEEIAGLGASDKDTIRRSGAME